MNFSFMPGTILRKGMKVRFRLRNSKSGRIAWEDEVIIKANTGATCTIEYVNSAGEKEQTLVKNRDIQSRFQLPFNGIGDLFPSIQMPKRMFAEGSAVEVTNGSKVFLGTVVSSSEQDNTYVILYSDGRKEKKVQADRVRLSLRKLKIGTEGEMIVHFLRVVMGKQFGVMCMFPKCYHILGTQNRQRNFKTQHLRPKNKKYRSKYRQKFERALDDLDDLDWETIPLHPATMCYRVQSTLASIYRLLKRSRDRAASDDECNDARSSDDDTDAVTAVRAGAYGGGSIGKKQRAARRHSEGRKSAPRRQGE